MDTYHRGVVGGTTFPLEVNLPNEKEIGKRLADCGITATPTKHNIRVCDWETRVRVMFEIIESFEHKSLKYKKCNFRYNRYLAVKLYNRLPINFDSLRYSLRSQIEHTFGLDLSGDNEKLAHILHQAYDINIDAKMLAISDAQDCLERAIVANRKHREEIKQKNEKLFEKALEMKAKKNGK
jgi:hypothetical protein